MRQIEEHHRQPSAAILDSQNVKTTERGGISRSYDASKKISGRKRHILVDMLGLLLPVVVHGADIQDQVGSGQVLELLRYRFMRLRLIWADGGYWVRSLRHHHRLHLKIIKRSGHARGFVPLPRRWVVERRFAWPGFHRRLSKNYEAFPETARHLFGLR